MGNKEEFETVIKHLTDITFNQRKLWEQRRYEAEARVKTLDAKLAAYQTTLKDYWESIDRSKLWSHK